MSRVVWAFDTETGLIAPGVIAPPLVCVSWAVRSPGGDGINSGLSDAIEGPSLVRHALESGSEIVGQNTSYDLAVLMSEDPSLGPLVIQALDEGRVHDTMLREQLIDIGRGRFRFSESFDEETGEVIRSPRDYSLEAIAARRLGRALDKGEDGWRLRYLELLATPIAQWPERARQYAELDAVTTLEVFEQQALDATNLHDEAAQVRAAFALHLTGARGLCVDLDAVDALETDLRAKSVAARAAVEPLGIYRANGTKDMARLRALVEAAYERNGGSAPRTATGEVQTSMAVLRDSEDPALLGLAEAAKVEKLLTAFVPALRLGANAPLGARYNVLVESGRTSCSGIRVGKRKGPNVQQLPRDGAVREVFVARPGYLLCSVDYSALELRTLAQVCLNEIGYSQLAEAFRAERDPHLELAAEILGVDSAEAAARFAAGDKAVKLARQQAKPANFGFPGGLGVRKFCAYAKQSYGVVFSESEASALRDRWRARWPEVVELQRRVGAALDPVTETVDIEQACSKRVRGRCGYTEACNSFFQGLAADGAKAALWRVARDGSAHGVYPVAFVHDEILAEVPESSAHEAATWLARTMCEAMQVYCPGVPIEAEPALARRWYKAMGPVFEDGRLVAWEPEAREASSL